MPLDQIRSFLVFARSQSIYEAAEELGLTQPAVSQHLAIVESYFGQKIFEMSGRKKVLNAYGQLLYDRLSGKMGELESEVKQVKLKLQDPSEILLKIGGRQGALNRVLIYLNYKGPIELINIDGEDIHGAIIRHHINFGISRNKIPDKAIRSLELVSSAIYIVTHKKNAATKEKLNRLAKSKKFLQQTPFHTYSQNYPHAEEWIQQHDVDKEELNTRLIVNSWDAVLGGVIQNEGYTICPYDVIPHKDSRFVYTELKSVNPFVLYLHYLQGTAGLYPVESLFEYKK